MLEIITQFVCIIQTLKHASTPVARFGSVRCLNRTVRFVNCTVRFVNGMVRFVNGTVRFRGVVARLRVCSPLNFVVESNKNLSLNQIFLLSTKNDEITVWTYTNWHRLTIINLRYDPYTILIMETIKISTFSILTFCLLCLTHTHRCLK